jgi:glycosyltransferase involved in cell wall biosynthesis
MMRPGSHSPTIATVIPVYNGAAYIAEAIKSVFDQSKLPNEVIVVNDGSTDNSAEVLNELSKIYNFRIINCENGGQSAARNLGVEHARSDVIAFLDQDDIWYPEHLEALSAPFSEVRRDNLGWVYSDLDEIDEHGRMVCHGVIARHPHLVHPKVDLNTYLGQDMFMLPSASLILREAYWKIGGFNERLSGYEDDDLFLRLFRAGFNCKYISRPLSKWRIYQKSSSYSARMAISRFAFAQMLIDEYPNEPERSLYYIQDLIAPRFFRSMAFDYRRCVIIGNREQQKVTYAHLKHIVRYLRLRQRLPLQLFVLPMLRVRWFASVAMRWRFLNRIVARWVP